MRNSFTLWKSTIKDIDRHLRCSGVFLRSAIDFCVKYSLPAVSVIYIHTTRLFYKLYFMCVLIVFCVLHLYTYI